MLLFALCLGGLLLSTANAEKVFYVKPILYPRLSVPLATPHVTPCSTIPTTPASLTTAGSSSWKDSTS